MVGDTGDGDSSESKRRAFLQQCGRFAVATPPVIALMLTVSDRAEAVTSAKPTSTTTTTLTTTTPTTKTVTSATTKTQTLTTTTSLITTITGTLTLTKTVTLTVTLGSTLINEETSPKSKLATMIDSMV
jgi:hypothetical protein